MGLDNVFFEVRDALGVEGEQRFDLVTTFDAVHDQADPAGFLAVAFGLLRPGGTYLCVEPNGRTEVADNRDHPTAVFRYTNSLYHCMSVSLAQGGAGLGSMWGQEMALDMLSQAGFQEIRVEQVDGDRLNNYYIARK